MSVLSVRLSVLLSARLSAHLLLSLLLCLSTRLCLCHFQLKCRPRPIKFLAKFIRDFCPRCRCRTRTIALYTIINGNFCWFLLVSNIICYFCLLFSMFTALPFRQLPPIWMPSRRSPMRPPIPEVSSKVVNIKKNTRNEMKLSRRQLPVIAVIVLGLYVTLGTFRTSIYYLCVYRATSTATATATATATLASTSVIDLILHISRLFPLGRVE